MAEQEKTRNEASQTDKQKHPLDEAELEQIVGGTGEQQSDDSQNQSSGIPGGVRYSGSTLTSIDGQPLKDKESSG